MLTHKIIYIFFLLKIGREANHYKIDPKSIPRPTGQEEIYINDFNTNFYLMDDSESSRIPYSNSQFVVKETYNTSLRNMRASNHFLPLKNNFYEKTGLPLGVYFQPFADRDNGESPIPTVIGN